MGFQLIEDSRSDTTDGQLITPARALIPGDRVRMITDLDYPRWYIVSYVGLNSAGVAVAKLYYKIGDSTEAPVIILTTEEPPKPQLSYSRWRCWVIAALVVWGCASLIVLGVVMDMLKLRAR